MDFPSLHFPATSHSTRFGRNSFIVATAPSDHHHFLAGLGKLLAYGSFGSYQYLLFQRDAAKASTNNTSYQQKSHKNSQNSNL
jgi:hypothetical protein